MQMQLAIESVLACKIAAVQRFGDLAGFGHEDRAALVRDALVSGHLFWNDGNGSASCSSSSASGTIASSSSSSMRSVVDGSMSLSVVPAHRQRAGALIIHTAVRGDGTR